MQPPPRTEHAHQPTPMRHAAPERRSGAASEPTGAVIADGDELRTQDVWTVHDQGRTRELVLRVGRGFVREVGP